MNTRRQTINGGFYKAAIAVVIVAVLASLALSFLNPNRRRPSKARLLHTVERGDLIVSVNEEGRLESANNHDIKCKVKGGSTILWIIESGAIVKAGDELVRLDKSSIEDDISQKTITFENARAAVVQSESDVKDAEISITEYEQAVFVSDLKTAEKNVTVAKTRLEQAEQFFRHTEKLAAKGFVNRQRLRSDAFTVREAQLDLEIQQSLLDGLQRFTREKRLQELTSTLKAAEARLASNRAALQLEETRLSRARLQLENCTIKAERSGMVLYPSAAEWKEAPDIEEGAAVREQQLLLVMPDLKQMQVKVGIHESKVKQIKIGAPAEIKLLDKRFSAKVKSVASAAAPAGWWNGNAVKFATSISIETTPGLKPGMSADVEIFLKRFSNVLRVPVAAVVELKDGYYCFVESDQKPIKRAVTLGESNDNFVIIDSGLEEGEEVLLNASSFVDSKELLGKIKPSPLVPNSIGGEAEVKVKTTDTSGTAAKKPAEQLAAKRLIGRADANKDGYLTSDEFEPALGDQFEAIDLDDDGRVDAEELETALKDKIVALDVEDA